MKQYHKLFAASVAISLAICFILLQVVGAYIRSKARESLARPRIQLVDAITQDVTRGRVLAVCDQIFASPQGERTSWPLEPDLTATLGCWRIFSDLAPHASDQPPKMLYVWCGGADNHFGLVITPSNDQEPHPLGVFTVRKKLGPRVWYYDELELELEPAK